MKAIYVIGLITLVFSCKKQPVEDPVQLISNGSIVASFNGKSWPALAQNGAAVEVAYFRGNGYCNPERRPLFGVTIRYQPNAAYRLYEEASISLHLPTTGTNIVVSPASNANEMECLRLARGEAIGRFSHTGFDGTDLIRFSSYSVRTDRINQLIISRIDTVAKVMEGSFEANFIRQGSGTSTYPDTIQIKCSKFVAPI